MAGEGPGTVTVEVPIGKWADEKGGDANNIYVLDLVKVHFYTEILAKAQASAVNQPQFLTLNIVANAAPSAAESPLVPVGSWWNDITAGALFIKTVAGWDAVTTSAVV